MVWSRVVRTLGRGKGSVMGQKMMLMLVGVAVLVLGLPSVAAAQESDTEPSATVVVLVDLSGSLRQRDIADEIRAVGVMNTVPGIDLYVIGFASDGTLPATVVVCEPGDDLSQCTQALTARSNAQGNDTDHAAALEAAAEVLGPAGPDGSSPRIVLFLTDGEYDPSGSGSPTADELAGLSSALEELRDANVSVWPIGFGRATKRELNDLAIAAPGSCKEARGLLVGDSQDVPPAVNKIIGLADCSGTVNAEQLVVLPETGLVVVTFGEDELSDATVTVRTESRDRGRFDCVFDDVAGVWTCEIPTDSLGTGVWELSPTPSLYPTPYQQEASTSQTTTTSVAPSSTTSTSLAETTTTQATPSPPAAASTTAANEALAADADGGALPLAVVVVAILALIVGGGAFVWSRRS